jgi:hypothetical protein
MAEHARVDGAEDVHEKNVCVGWEQEKGARVRLGPVGLLPRHNSFAPRPRTNPCPLPNSSSPITAQAQQEQEEKQDEVDTYLENMNMIRSMNDNPRF